MLKPVIAESIKSSIANGSWIRKMFESGIALKKQYGESAVYDFSLGNPDLPPPVEVSHSLRDLATEATKPFALGYMPNGGFPHAREVLATHLGEEQNIKLTLNEVVLTNGAAGALNIFFKSVLNPEDEVLAITPYFVEYKSYVTNHGGIFKTVASNPENFSLDISKLDEAITKNTRVLIINSPNNPTGQVYSEQEINELALLLKKKSNLAKRPIFLVADEPYRFLTYDNVIVPSILPKYEWSVVVSSFSKNLSIPGERIGYIALSPLMEGREDLVSALLFTNRILGFVNPPVVGQHIMLKALNSQVDVSVYVSRRNAMANVLKNAGYDFFMPRGAFYFFPKAPGGDDIAFVEKLLEQKILAVPGTGFGSAGYFRLAFCVDESIINRSFEGFKKAIQQ